MEDVVRKGRKGRYDEERNKEKMGLGKEEERICHKKE